MKAEDEDLKHIERYYFGEMLPKEKLIFEARLLIEDDLKEDYSLFVDVHGALNMEVEEELRVLMQKEEKKSLVLEMSSVNKKETENTFTKESIAGKGSGYAKMIKMRQYKIAMSIAAVLLVGVFIWQPQNDTNSALFSEFYTQQYYTPGADSYNYENSDNIIRGKGAVLMGLSEIESDEVFDAIQLMEENKFEQAADKLERINLSVDLNPRLIFYRAIASLKSKKIDESIRDFESILEITINSEIDCNIEFNLAVAYLGMGNKTLAKARLKSVIKSNCQESEQAKEIEERLRWSPFD
jgi:tetratricopeptide (TPR) repeat protein